MIVYRLTLPQHANDFSGIGASIYGGRWNKVGSFVLYTAQTSSLSILEHLAHMKGALSHPKYVLSIIEVEGEQVEEKKAASSILSMKESQNIGSDWVISLKSPVLKVPSIINPLEFNFLINPNHEELSMKLIDQEWFMYDDRLVKN